MSKISNYKQNFLNLAIAEKALTFGEFVLKSGRISPYFFNASVFYKASSLSILSDAYSQAILDKNLDFDVIFGPAYKGIPLASATALSYYKMSGKNVAYAFDRKEAKDHGEGGNLVGSPLNGKKVLLIDDVITAGTAITQAAELIEKSGGKLAGIMLALDRQEKIQTEKSAIEELSQKLNTKIFSLINLDDLFSYIKNNPEFAAEELAMQAYRLAYGV